MSFRLSFAVAGSLILVFPACGGSSQTTLGDSGIGGSTTATGGFGSGNSAGETGAGGTSADGGSQGGGNSSGGKSGGSGNQVCTPYDTGVCTGPGACVGGRQCDADGMGWSQCDCGTGGATATGGTVGTGGFVGNTGGAGPATGGASNTGGVFGVTGGTSSGGAATGGTGGSLATGGTSSGGASTGGSTTTGGSSTGGSSGSTDSCETAPTWTEWTSGATGMTGDRVRFQCSALQSGCSGKQLGVTYLFQCNQVHVPNCQNQNPQTGDSWSFVSECPGPADCGATYPFSYGTDDVYVTAVCAGGTPCVGATNGLTYKFECTNEYTCGAQDPGTTNWVDPPWKRVGPCE